MHLPYYICALVACTPKLRHNSEGISPRVNTHVSCPIVTCDSPPTDADRLPPFLPRRAGGCCERPSLIIAPRPKSRESSLPDRETVQIHRNGKPKDHSRFFLRLTPRTSGGMKKGPAWVQHLEERLRHLAQTPSRREKDSVCGAPQAGYRRPMTSQGSVLKGFTSKCLDTHRLL